MGIVKLLSFQHAVFTVAWNCGSQDMPDPSRAFGRIPGIFIRKRPVRHAILCKPLAHNQANRSVNSCSVCL